MMGEDDDELGWITCWQCGGEGELYGCSWDWQCDTWDGDSCLCSQRCDICDGDGGWDNEPAQGMALREDPQGAEGEACQPGDEVMRQTPTKEPLT